MKPENKAEEQIQQLANFIMSEIEGEPSQNESAVECAIRLLRKQEHANNKVEELQAEVERLKGELKEISSSTRQTERTLRMEIMELESERDQWKARCLDAAIDYSKPKL